MRGKPCLACDRDAGWLTRPGGYRFQGIHYRRARCRSCGLFGLDPIPTKELWPQIYSDAYFEGYSVHHSGGRGYVAGREVAARVADLRLERIAPHRPNGRLLELGCAGGHFLAAARDRGYSVHGVEYNGSMVSHARESYGLEVWQGDILEIEVPGRFDVICMEDVLEHLRDPLAVVLRLAGLLSPGGIVVIDGPLERQFNLSLALLELNLLMKPAEDPEMPPVHVWQFSLRTQRLLLQRAGLVERQAWVYQEPVPPLPRSGSLWRDCRRALADSVASASLRLSRSRALRFLQHGDRALVVYGSRRTS